MEPEVLEPASDWLKDVRIQAELRTIKVVVQRVIVNGEAKDILGEAVALVCPRCGQPLKVFPAGISAADVVKLLDTDKQKELDSWLCCDKCGQKLSIYRRLPLSSKGIVTEKTVSEESAES